MVNQLWNLAIWRQSAAACLSFSSINQTCLWCMITHQWAAGETWANPTSGWMEGHAADQWNLSRRFRWIPHGISLSWGCRCFPPQQPSVCQLPLDKPHVVIYPLMTALGSERTVVLLSTLLMSDTSKLALMLFWKDLALGRIMNNRFTFVRRTKKKHNLALVPWSLLNIWGIGGRESTILTIHMSKICF